MLGFWGGERRRENYSLVGFSVWEIDTKLFRRAQLTAVVLEAAVSSCPVPTYRLVRAVHVGMYL